MGIIQLKDVKVTNTFSKGFRVIEESKGRDGKDHSTRYTVWSDSLGVREGDVVSLSGFLGAKVSEWTDKEHQVRHSVELSINSPRLSSKPDDAAPAHAEDDWAQTAPEPEPWSDSSVPF